jgi:hypothetical protein
MYSRVAAQINGFHGPAHAAERSFTDAFRWGGKGHD